MSSGGASTEYANPPAGLVELHRRDTEVEQGGIDGFLTGLVEDIGDLVEGGLVQRNPVRVRFEPASRDLQGRGVAVDADEVHVRERVQDEFAVSAGPRASHRGTRVGLRIPVPG